MKGPLAKVNPFVLISFLRPSPVMFRQFFAHTPLAPFSKIDFCCSQQPNYFTGNGTFLLELFSGSSFDSGSFKHTSALRLGFSIAVFQFCRFFFRPLEQFTWVFFLAPLYSFATFSLEPRVDPPVF